jgi:hypothetical protein
LISPRSGDETSQTSGAAGGGLVRRAFRRSPDMDADQRAKRKLVVIRRLISGWE